MYLHLKWHLWLLLISIDRIDFPKALSSSLVISAIVSADEGLLLLLKELLIHIDVAFIGQVW